MRNSPTEEKTIQQDGTDSDYNLLHCEHFHSMPISSYLLCLQSSDWAANRSTLFTSSCFCAPCLGHSDWWESCCDNVHDYSNFQLHVMEMAKGCRSCLVTMMISKCLDVLDRKPWFHSQSKHLKYGGDRRSGLSLLFVVYSFGPIWSQTLVTDCKPRPDI